MVHYNIVISLHSFLVFKMSSQKFKKPPSKVKNNENWKTEAREVRSRNSIIYCMFIRIVRYNAMKMEKTFCQFEES